MGAADVVAAVDRALSGTPMMESTAIECVKGLKPMGSPGVHVGDSGLYAAVGPYDALCERARAGRARPIPRSHAADRAWRFLWILQHWTRTKRRCARPRRPSSLHWPAWNTTATLKRGHSLCSSSAGQSRPTCFHRHSGRRVRFSSDHHRVHSQAGTTHTAQHAANKAGLKAYTATSAANGAARVNMCLP